ncbi:hypothetical protein OGAPHI_002546 [Ogataea philodendri]|uniref:Mitochondrial import receptor subunit TOM70 n=1 Tax=Ogataea philodendri TaxID=1378263 RepID=A0A9P8T7G6_9ASCO|nr:uncharacterized protein OGAPHI_002546 [Ogataea philodendri]KAH3668791.1 hypothetical protein OGAPHI_002546 [Ogataea philodendri]
MSESSFSRFIQAHKVAVAVTAVVGAGSVAGLLYYMSQQNAGLDDSESLKPKKKSKATKKKKKSEKSGTVVHANWPSSDIPIDSTTGLPNVTEELVTKMTKQQQSEWALALKETGNQYYKAEDFKPAIQCYTLALLCKADPVFYANRAAAYAAQGEHQKCIDDCTEALKLNPSYPKCLLRRAHAYENIEKYEEAIYDLTALTIYGGLNDQSPESILERNLKKLANKINEEQYSTLPKELPSSSSISSFFGAFAKENVDTDESKYEDQSCSQFLAKALTEIAKDTYEDYVKADVLIHQAIASYEKDPPKADSKHAGLAYEYQGTFDFLKGESESAVSNLNKALQLNPRGRTHVLLGLVNADKGDFLSADQAFAQAIKLNPEDPDIYYHYGQLYYLMGDLEKAKENFEKSKLYNPDNVFGYIQLACIAYKNGDTNSCDEQFKDAKKRFPTSSEVPNYYGEILFDRQDYGGAAKQFEISARLQESLPTFNIGALPLINKSAICQVNKDIVGCEEILKKACELDPKSEVARINLGQIYLQQQKVQDAIALFKDACRLSRSNDDRVQAISLMEASKIQLKIKQDPVLSKKVHEIMERAGLERGL